MPTAAETVRDFKGLRALVIGDAMLDSYLVGTAERLCREGPVPVVRQTGERRTPGGAANSAANLAALGAEVSLLGVVGRDAGAVLLRSALHGCGVDDRSLVEDDQGTTLHKLRIVADGHYVVRFDEGVWQNYTPRTESLLVAHLEEAYDRCDVIVLSDYGYGVITRPLTVRLHALRQKSPRPLLIDSKRLPFFYGLQPTLVTPNRAEACMAVGLDESDGRPVALESVGRRLLQAIDAEYVAITLAADGVLLLENTGPARHLPTHPVARANDVGAGDSFAAGAALALGAGASVHQAVEIGIDAGSIAVSKEWTSLVHHQELLQRVSLGDYHRRRADESGSPRWTMPHELAPLLANERAAGRRIVFTNGIFDILHAGHVTFLRQARGLGDLLVVGINSDAGLRRRTGYSGPINSEQDRAALVEALDPVDYVVIFDQETPSETIRLVRPTIHVKGGDYAREELPEAEAVREVGGQVIILPLAGGLDKGQHGPTWVAEERVNALLGARP